MSGRPGDQRPAVWRGPYWSWASKDTDERVAREHLDGRVTLNELLEHVREVAPDASWDEITVSAHLTWSRQATGEEIAERAEGIARQEARHREWQTRIMRTLIDEYGPDTSTWPAMSSEELAAWREQHWPTRASSEAGS